jgi:hypothetical protein
MHAILNPLNRVMQIAAAMLAIVSSISDSQADIFQRACISPADPSQGKPHRAVLVPDSVGVNAATNDRG